MSDSDTEWEDEIRDVAVEEKDILPGLVQSQQHDDDGSDDDHSTRTITVPHRQSSIRKKKNFYDKAMATLEREFRINTHKAHLLCLVSHGVSLSVQCNHQLLQCLLVSMVTDCSLLDITSDYDLSRLLKWFSSNVDNLSKVASDHAHLFPSKQYSCVQLLVAILRGVGLRTRIVLVLKATPLKVTPPTKPLSTSPADSQCDTTSLSPEVMEPSKKERESGKTTERKRRKGKGRQESDEDLKLKRFSYDSSSKTSPYFRKRSSSTSSSSNVACGYQPVAKRRKKSSSPVTMETVDTPTNNEDTLKHLYDSTSSWTEVHIKGKWVCLHPSTLSVGQPSSCEKHYNSTTSYRLQYVIGIDNGSHVSDVTARYDSHWCTCTLKNRVGVAWWAESLRSYAPPIDEQELEEEDIMGILLSRPLPTSMSDYKGHPLYVLKRHLLKFKVIYPEESQMLGYFKGEPVYSRACVHTLHTRETWLKEARLVRRNEKPYKIVKGRKKKGQTSLEAESNTAEVFGAWQTEEYIPPPVVNGKVTRNEYGNVELFKPSMLPAGAVHLKAAGIAKVARKLDIDYAPAMMGWDHSHGGHCHPVIEGIVVAEEYKDTLLEAWDEEQHIVMEANMKKREKRAIDRWIKLTRGLLIMERVNKRFQAQN